MKSYLSGALAPPTQQEAAPGTIENTAGGQSFPVDPWGRLHRFLILGSEGGTYYAGERSLTVENVQNLRDLLDEDGLRFIAEVVGVSRNGRAPKNDPAILALALAASAADERIRAQALLALPVVCRTGTHLFTFLGFVDQLRGWGRGLRTAVGRWYTEKEDSKLGYQLVKYRQRDGWTHRDALRLAHPKGKTPAQEELLSYAAGKKGPVSEEHVVLFENLQGMEKPETVAQWIRNAKGKIVREMIPPQFLGDADVQRAMLEQGMPLTALIRNLGNLTRLGVLVQGKPEVDLVLEALGDKERISHARVHPIAVLSALRTYSSGHGFRGSGNWAPVPSIVDALNDAFYLAFGNVEATGKRILFGLDVSGSMGFGEIAGVPGLTPRDATAALTLVTAAVEKNYSVYGFTSGSEGRGYRYRPDGAMDGFVPLSITPRQRLDDAVREVSRQDFGSTDCALPMLKAIELGLDVDAFIVMTDNETWAGKIHPDEALRQYRRKSGIDAKLVVVGMTATRFSIANPNDPGMLDCVGFDTRTPQAISEFIR